MDLGRGPRVRPGAPPRRAVHDPARRPPQLSPVACGVHDGQVVDQQPRDRDQDEEPARDPRASLCVLSDGFFGDWVQVDGTAEIVSLPDAMEPLVEYYRSLSGEHPDWDEYRAAMTHDRRVLIRDHGRARRPQRQRLTGRLAGGRHAGPFWADASGRYEPER